MRLFISFVFLFSLISISAQDTTWVNTFHFASDKRDTLIEFPNVDQNGYEKILMYYTMRCKNGLVSTTSDRNKGCGEWDYSCNTSIIDSSRVDSVLSYHDNYLVRGLFTNFFPYTTSPTYTYTDYSLNRVTVSNTSNIEKITIGNPQANNIIINKDKNKGKFYLYFSREDLNKIQNGQLIGLGFTYNGAGTVEFMKIKLAYTSSDSFDLESLTNLTFDEVVNRDVTFNQGGDGNVFFQTPFSLSNQMAVVAEISYHSSPEKLGTLEILGTQDIKNPSVVNFNDKYLVSGRSSSGRMSTDAFRKISNEITVAFWSKGDEIILPANTAILNATDDSGNRQLNVHLPWANGKIYWDCGYSSGSYDRLEKAAVSSEYKGQWNFWSFTKNALSGTMKIYLNGVLWASATGKNKPIDITQFIFGSGLSNNVPYFGYVDDFSIWNRELSVSEIQKIMYHNPAWVAVGDPSLVAYYDMNTVVDNKILDKSIYQGNISYEDKIFTVNHRANNYFKSFTPESPSLDISLISGSASLNTQTITVRDSTENLPYEVIPFSVLNSKLVQGAPLYYWLGGYQSIFDEDGNIIGEVEFPIDDILEINDLEYYNFSPAKFELMSFVTPYGIGLNFGNKGKTWVFDVTDYGPILKGTKRLLMDRGGQNQEQMDIKFAFIKGTPTRNVLDILQVWPVNSYNYTDIINNRQLEPRKITLDDNVKNVKVRTVGTGHGQEGEFIPRTHSININGGPTEFSWSLWKECADNPIYPQGGTWIYDRAGWCPGAPSDVYEYEIKNLITGNSFTIDYGLNTASGDSRYIINTQVVKYGPFNFDTDASLEDIIVPSSKVEYTRWNPNCDHPLIKIKNNGSQTITSLDIEYGVIGVETKSYQWSGNLGSLSTKEIELPLINRQAFISNGRFFVKIISVNGTADQNSNNNALSSEFLPVKVIYDGIIVSMKTNGLPKETTWKLEDSDGNIIKSSRSNMSSFTTYNDTIRNLIGCYSLTFSDSDEDGISWWANGDGDGFIRMKPIQGNWTTFEPDFGKFYRYNFVAEPSTSSQDISSDAYVKISPNPTSGPLNILIYALEGTSIVEIFDQTGKQMLYQPIYQGNITDFSYDIDISAFPSGFYYLQLKSGLDAHVYKIIKI
ncbi:MAG: T9SS type A sorting domain-containing protein [Lewinellaceae bacterium]|nr:T9SS type A sorting domain-containing protein [Lewinellaceae bacterium]